MRQSIASSLLVVAAAWSGNAWGGALPLPDDVRLPPGFVVDAARSEVKEVGKATFPFPDPSSPTHAWTDMVVDGRLMRVAVRAEPAVHGDRAAAIAAFLPIIVGDGFQVLASDGRVVAHREANGRDSWLRMDALDTEAIDLTLVEKPAWRYALALDPPAPGKPLPPRDDEDFPFLKRFPGSRLKQTKAREACIDVQAPSEKEEKLVGPPTVEKEYSLSQPVSGKQFVEAYREALLRAGWQLVGTAEAPPAVGDAWVVAHYGKAGRDVWVELQQTPVPSVGVEQYLRVVDFGVENSAARLRHEIDAKGHVAVYGLYYEPDSAVLRPESEATLAGILDLLLGNPQLSLELRGHTDSSGIPSRNQELSALRAVSVRSYLLAHQVAAARLTTSGYGSTRPVGDNRVKEGRALNRRLELVRR